jgi:DNA-binding SARP family transcriptional activator
MRFDIKLLGPLEATVNGVSIVPSAGKPRQLLAILALNAGGAIPTTALMAELWADLPPRAANTTLHTYIGKLRRALEHALQGPSEPDAKEVLVTEKIGYRLKAPPEASDVGRYDELVDIGRRAAEREEYETAANTLAAALAMWRGPALSDIATGRHLTVEKVRLEEGRLSVLDLRIEMDLRLGRHRRLLGELAGLCERFPMGENFCDKYMLALYRSGQQWRALQVFQRLRTTMVEELGVDPSATMQRLHLAVLRGDPVVDSPRFLTSDWTDAQLLTSSS